MVLRHLPPYFAPATVVVMFNAHYFETLLDEDVRSLRDGPPSVVVTLTDGSEVKLWSIVAAREGTITMQVFPADGRPPREYPKEDRAAGMPRYYADVLVVPYSSIHRVRLTMDAPARPEEPRFAGFDRARPRT
jgi:hypothetical protein